MLVTVEIERVDCNLEMEPELQDCRNLKQEQKEQSRSFLGSVSCTMV